MRPRSKAPLAVVPDAPPPPPNYSGDIYAADKARIAATDWGALHIASDHSESVALPDLAKRDRRSGVGVRTERGGFLKELRP